MPFVNQKILRHLSLSALLGSALALFGGCGGSSSNATMPGGAGGGTSPPASAGTEIWFYSNETSHEGTWATVPNGSIPRRKITNDTEPHPWPDGKQHLEYILTQQQFDTLKSINSITGALVNQVAIAHFTGNIEPHPTNKSLMLGRQATDTNSDNGFLLIVDMAQTKVVHAEPTLYLHHRFAWLPDGRYLRIHTETGEIAAASIGGTWQVLGRVPIPTNRRLNRFAVNPQGTQLLMIFRSYDDYAANNPGLDSDAWVSNINGENFKRFTATNRTYRALWSPDGAQIAFDMDTSHCQDLNCSGECTSWYASASESKISQLVSGQQSVKATQLRQRMSDKSQETVPLGCDITAWVSKP